MTNVLDDIANAELEGPTRNWTCPGRCQDDEMYFPRHLPALKAVSYNIYSDPDTTGPCLHCGTTTKAYYVERTSE